MCLGVLAAGLDEGADQGRRRVVLRDLVALDDLPVPCRCRVHRITLVEHAGRAVVERAVDDVAVAGHPADVGRAPPDVAVLDVEHPAVRGGCVGEVAARGVNGRLRLGGGTGRVQAEQRVLRLDRLGRMSRRLALDRVVPPVVAALPHGHVCSRAPQHQHALDGGRQRDGFVGDRLQRDRRALAPGLVLRDQEPRAGALQPLAQRGRREPAEHDHVRRADAGTGQHRHGQLRHHPHVDADHVTLADPQLPQRGGGAADLFQQLGVADRAVRLVRILRHEVVGDAVAASCLDVTVEAGVGGVQPAVAKPPAVRRLPFECRLRLLEPPHQPARLVQPEPVKVALGMVV